MWLIEEAEEAEARPAHISCQFWLHHVADAGGGGAPRPDSLPVLAETSAFAAPLRRLCLVLEFLIGMMCLVQA